MISLILGYALDLLFGDPQGLPHPIRLIGTAIIKLEAKLRKKCKSPQNEYIAGIVLWVIIVLSSLLIPLILLSFISKFSITLAVIFEGIMCYYVLAAKCLKDESMKVYYKLKEKNITEARKYLSYIVGRDTENLDEDAIIKAAVETVSENTSDGVIAPLLYMLIGGAPLGFMYKAVNTLDSMVGYKNDKYINLGRFSAKADDAANFFPARISAYMMILASAILRLDYKSAYRIYKRDRYNHLSPNSAHTESVCAGALGIELAGGSYYSKIFVKKPTIGDDVKKIEIEDIKTADKLMYTTSILCLLLGTGLKIIINFIF